VAGEPGNGDGHVTVSVAMERVWALVLRVADTDVPVLLAGESGVGKDVVARGIHATSLRAEKPFVKINCAALPGELLESELFGHEKGSFTGAHADKPGKFELADGGTIFLDEIGEMDPRLQAKLLQVLQDEEFYRVGGTRSRRVDARVVVATNRDLEQEIASGGFRHDLYYRLNVVTIRVPPLRERKEDIVPLVRHFVEKYLLRYPGGLDRVPDELMERFHAHDWPGNVRELENLVRRLVVLKDPSTVVSDLTAPRCAPPATPTADPGMPEASDARPSSPASVQAPLPDDAPLKEVGKRAAQIADRGHPARADPVRLEQAQGGLTPADQLQGRPLQDQGLPHHRPASDGLVTRAPARQGTLIAPSRPRSARWAGAARRRDPLHLPRTTAGRRRRPRSPAARSLA
jgi:two-component system response regulator AtoC